MEDVKILDSKPEENEHESLTSGKKSFTSHTESDTPKGLIDDAKESSKESFYKSSVVEPNYYQLDPMQFLVITLSLCVTRLSTFLQLVSCLSFPPFLGSRSYS